MSNNKLLRFAVAAAMALGLVFVGMKQVESQTRPGLVRASRLELVGSAGQIVARLGTDDRGRPSQGGGDGSTWRRLANAPKHPRCDGTRHAPNSARYPTMRHWAL